MGPRGSRIYSSVFYSIASDIRSPRGIPTVYDAGQTIKTNIHARRQQMRQAIRAGGVARRRHGAGQNIWMRVPGDFCEDRAKCRTPFHEPRPHAPKYQTGRARCTTPRTAGKGGAEEEMYYHVGDWSCYIRWTLDSPFSPFTSVLMIPLLFISSNLGFGLSRVAQRSTDGICTGSPLFSTIFMSPCSPSASPFHLSAYHATEHSALLTCDVRTKENLLCISCSVHL